MSRCALGLFAPAMLLPLALAGQAPERGGFIVRLGNDTVAVERFSRTRTQLEDDVVGRSPRTSLVHYVATLGPTGRVTRFEAAVYAAATGFAGTPLQTSTVTLSGDTAIVQVRGGPRGDRTSRIPIRPGAIPVPRLTFAFYEQMIRQARAEKRDTVLADMVFPPGETAIPTRLVMRGDSAIVDLFGLPAYARLDNIGRVLNLDGRQTTDKVLVDRVDNVNVDSLAKVFAARETATGPMGQLSPRDTAHAMIGNAMVMVDYGRPHQRGRQIFGGVVPYGEVWRTGANAATQFTTSAPITLAGLSLPAGTYTLWTVPHVGRVDLIVNKQTGQWGTEYSRTQDLGTVAMRSDSVDTPVEKFTISIEPDDARHGTLAMAWGTFRWTVPIVVQEVGR
jgi:hypothetical protein